MSRRYTKSFNPPTKETAAITLDILLRPMPPSPQARTPRQDFPCRGLNNSSPAAGQFPNELCVECRLGTLFARTAPGFFQPEPMEVQDGHSDTERERQA